jgi:hypothetical protein
LQHNGGQRRAHPRASLAAVSVHARARECEQARFEGEAVAPSLPPRQDGAD